jgi:AraC family transcriptional regulator, regulatory protein of adaptative response / DNA-3-methyladenine glycosylase II
MYRAMESRDRRFDGRFFVAVESTGVYCRPICPAPTPRRAVSRFYRYAAVAELAGFRPCRRCRPEASPDTDEWDTHVPISSDAACVSSQMVSPTRWE